MSTGRRRLVAVDDEAVIADYEVGVTIAAICERYQIPVLRLYRVLNEHQIARRRPQAPRLAPSRERQILADYAAGVTVRTIYRTHQISSAAMYQILRPVPRLPKRRLQCADGCPPRPRDWFSLTMPPGWLVPELRTAVRLCNDQSCGAVGGRPRVDAPLRGDGTAVDERRARAARDVSAAHQGTPGNRLRARRSARLGRGAT